MADTNTGATGQTPPNHLGTDVPSGHLDEKKEYGPGGNGDNHKDVPPKKETAGDGDEEEDEDIDALIEELESQDAAVDDEEEDVQPGGARTVPEDMLRTDTRLGLSSAEVLTRRKKYGLNQMKEEKENLILKFLGFFIGPIQFVMEVSQFINNCTRPGAQTFSHRVRTGVLHELTSQHRLPPCLLPVFRTG